MLTIATPTAAFELRHTAEETREEYPTEPRMAVARYYAMNDRRETVRLPAAAIASLANACAEE